jgi:Zn-dependent protease
MIFSLLQSPIDFLAIVVGFLVIGITVHEFAHAYVANRFGDPTAKMMGRVSLNPLAHLDPMGTILFFLVGFGWGKPVPLNPHYLHRKSDELKVAIAGILTNLLVATILAIPLRIATIQGVMIDSNTSLLFLKKIVEINVLLAAFNILPFPPLDGSHFIEHFLSEESRIKFMSYGQYLLLGIIMYDILTGNSIIFSIIEPIMRGMLFLVSGSFAGSSLF